MDLIIPVRGKVRRTGIAVGGDLIDREWKGCAAGWNGRKLEGARRNHHVGCLQRSLAGLQKKPSPVRLPQGGNIHSATQRGGNPNGIVGDEARHALPAHEAVRLIAGIRVPCQIAEDLREAGRKVFYSIRRHRRMPRRYRGHDLGWWLEAACSITPAKECRQSGATRRRH